MQTFDLLGIGNAIVDVIAPVDPAFLAHHAMRPGAMALIDATAAGRLTAAMPAGRESSGGSVANSCAVAALLGAKVAFLGKVANDPIGAAFARDIAAAGVHFPTPPDASGAPTARSLILVTPDGQRTMNTYLGACVDFAEADLSPSLIAQSAIVYLEGYLFDLPPAQAAFRQAAALARAAGRKVALSLSDPFCVARHRAAFLALLPAVDILFANEAEITSLHESDSFTQAADLARQAVPLAILTQGEAGSLILTPTERTQIPAVPTTVVDTTGAGDCYAAGFLAAYTSGAPLAACGRLGSAAAAACIAAYGARPDPAILRRLSS